MWATTATPRTGGTSAGYIYGERGVEGDSNERERGSVCRKITWAATKKEKRGRREDISALLIFVSLPY